MVHVLSREDWEDRDTKSRNNDREGSKATGGFVSFKPSPEPQDEYRTLKDILRLDKEGWLLRLEAYLLGLDDDVSRVKAAGRISRLLDELGDHNIHDRVYSEMIKHVHDRVHVYTDDKHLTVYSCILGLVDPHHLDDRDIDLLKRIYDVLSDGEYNPENNGGYHRLRFRVKHLVVEYYKKNSNLM